MASAYGSQHLHDKATRSEALSPKEQEQLEQWYTLQDRDESHTLSLEMHDDALATLQAQLTAALSQLTTVTQRIQDTVAENDTLRHDITVLRRQLAHILTSRPV
jgi:septal ring factor EnvC (AmiA/AmiB activator)